MAAAHPVASAGSADAQRPIVDFLKEKGIETEVDLLSFQLQLARVRASSSGSGAEADRGGVDARAH